MSGMVSKATPSASRKRARRVIASLAYTSLISILSVISVPAHAAMAHYNLVASMPGSLYSSTAQLAMPTGLIWHPSGLLIGTASSGGQYGNGGIFQVTQNGVYSSLLDLTTTLGPLEQLNQTWHITSAPTLALGSDSNIYGWTFWDTGNTSAGGSVFKLTTAGSVSTVYHFGDYLQPTGAIPVSMSLAADGNFYGFTTEGGAYNFGVLFKLTPGGQESAIYAFSVGTPSSVVVGSDGNFYGVRAANKITNMPSVVFKVTPGGTYSELYTFSRPDAYGHNLDGDMPDTLIQGADSNLYGATTSGGATGGGVVFRITTSGQFAVLHTFDYVPGIADDVNGGMQPRSLQMGADGNLYGVTFHDASNDMGTLFRLSTTGTYTTLHTLNPGEGQGPSSMIAGGQPRTFFGTTYSGGSNNGGAIFKLVVPIKNDLSGSGISNVITYAPGAFTTGLPGRDGSVRVASRVVSSGYYPVATGDFNGDGIADILWTSANNDLYIWAGTPNGYVSSYVGTYPAGWTVIGTGDMDGDGKDDIVWLNSATHQIAYWLMNGAVRTGSLTRPYTAGYYPVAIGDFDGDGKADVLWTSASRDLWIWSSTGSGFSSRYVTNYPAGWNITGVADVNGDGVDDLIWSSVDGQHWGYWLMRANASPTIVPLTAPNSLAGYSVVAAADYNGDGVADVLWSDGTHLAITANNGECVGSANCTFTPSIIPMTLPQGQSVLNTGVASQPK